MDPASAHSTVKEEKRKWKMQFRDIVNASLSQPISMQFLEMVYIHIARGHQLGFVPGYGLGPLSRPNAKNLTLDSGRFLNTDVNHSRLPDLRSFLFPACDDNKVWELSEDENGKKVKRSRAYNQKLYNLILHHSKGVAYLDLDDNEACDQCAGAGERNVMNHCSFAVNEEGDVMFNGWCLPCHMVANKKCTTIGKGGIFLLTLPNWPFITQNGLEKKRPRLPAVPIATRQGVGNSGRLERSKIQIEGLDDQDDNQFVLESEKKRPRLFAISADEGQLEKTKSRSESFDDQANNHIVLQSRQSSNHMVGNLASHAKSATICGSPSRGTAFSTPQKATMSYFLSHRSVDSRSPTIPPNTPATQARLEALHKAREALGG
ncbi:hypothetical protein BCR34DRAFT_654861 [Clohesyomyces aquaticus]|uniref:Uncharacterized protein n=1 Tax=Clohesyomyces aquaticus TaxID=1231657 RepID=A0A1Y1ZJV9_9PLEO|nr:hypothetical protein BCR34DRAFT_654861 [Clohesyomyces aquaticus]